jgi:hypothetical protein
VAKFERSKYQLLQEGKSYVMEIDMEIIGVGISAAILAVITVILVALFVRPSSCTSGRPFE